MRFARLWFTLALALTLIPSPLLVTPAPAAEEIVRMETRRVDCPTHPDGNRLCSQFIHQSTTTDSNETLAGRTFSVYTKDEIDARLKALKTMAAEIARLQHALAEIAPVCTVTPRAAAAD